MTDAPDLSERMGNPVGESTAKRLKAFGFDSGIPVYDFVKIAFDIADVKRALFDSDFSNPVTLSFPGKNADATTPIGIDLAMEVELVRASYETYETEINGVGVNRYDSPEYYIRGYLYGAGGDRRSIPMHVYLRVGDRNEFDSATVQVVFRPSGANTSTPFVYGRGPLGQEP
jgi:hypothetical protein